MKLATNLSKQEENDLVNLMETESGRAFVWRLLDKVTRFNESVSSCNAAVYYNLGAQDVGRGIHDDIMIVCPELYTKMRNEAIERESANERKA